MSTLHFHRTSAAFRRLALSACILFPVAIHAQSVPLVAFRAQNVATALSPFYVADGIASASVARGSGLSIRTDFPGYFDSGNWSQSPEFPGIADGHYLSLGIEIDALHTAELDSLHIAWQDGGSAESARRLELRWSVDGFETPLFTDFSVLSWPELDENTITLPAVGSLSGTVEFRLYGYGASASFGVLGLVNSAAFVFNNEDMALILSGEMTLIPEPAFAVLVFAMGALVFVVRRKRSSR